MIINELIDLISVSRCASLQKNERGNSKPNKSERQTGFTDFPQTRSPLRVNKRKHNSEQRDGSAYGVPADNWERHLKPSKLELRNSCYGRSPCQRFILR
jgi:hypothetical protein